MILDRANSSMYPFFLGAIAALDYCLFLVPMVPLTVASVAIVPRRWFWIGLSITLGSWIGSVIFASLVAHYGIDFLHWLAPQVVEGHIWKVMERWIQHFGLGAVVLVAVLPMVDHPMIALASLSKVPISSLALALLLGKSVKFFLFSWCGAYAPRLLHRLKFLKKN